MLFLCPDITVAFCRGYLSTISLPNRTDRTYVHVPCYVFAHTHVRCYNPFDWHLCRSLLQPRSSVINEKRNGKKVANNLSIGVRVECWRTRETCLCACVFLYISSGLAEKYRREVLPFFSSLYLASTYIKRERKRDRVCQQKFLHFLLPFSLMLLLLLLVPFCLYLTLALTIAVDYSMQQSLVLLLSAERRVTEWERERESFYVCVHRADRSCIGSSC